MLHEFQGCSYHKAVAVLLWAQAGYIKHYRKLSACCCADVKSSNILLSAGEGVAKLADVGASAFTT